jgi:hypothetical protein
MLEGHGWRRGTPEQRATLQVTRTSIRLITRRIGPDSKSQRIGTDLRLLMMAIAFHPLRKLASTSSQ